MNRRNFLLKATTFGLSALTLPGAQGRVWLPFAQAENDTRLSGYGALSPMASVNTGETILALPAGFQYTVFGKTGTAMSDGKATPPAHDGMACFAGADAMLRLVRNHELDSIITPPDPQTAYDLRAGGGTTTLVINPQTRLPVNQFLSLSGTVRNCGGGATPWGSWLTCEETLVGTRGGYAKSHGYVFEVPAAANSPVPAVPIKEMGRFAHEAAAVEPRSGFVYLTEDRNPCGFYRFIPNVRGNLSAGGRLQMLMINGMNNYDTRKNQTLNLPLPVRWVDIPNPDPADAETNESAVYQQGAAAGGAIFSRLEGCADKHGRIIFVSTSGGNAGRGQVWEYHPMTVSLGKLRLLYESPDGDVLDNPDNVCTNNRGAVLLCEDGGGDEFLRGLTPDGQVFDFAKNILNGGEFAGATFSPDGQTLFVNIQSPGMTLAIWGPWQNGQL